MTASADAAPPGSRAARTADARDQALRIIDAPAHGRPEPRAMLDKIISVLRKAPSWRPRSAFREPLAAAERDLAKTMTSIDALGDYVAQYVFADLGERDAFLATIRRLRRSARITRGNPSRLNPEIVLAAFTAAELLERFGGRPASCRENSPYYLLTAAIHDAVTGSGAEAAAVRRVCDRVGDVLARTRARECERERA